MSQLARTEIRRCDMQHLAGSDKVGRCFERFVHRSFRVREVLVVEIDPVGAQSRQADVAALAYALGERAGGEWLSLWPRLELGRDHDAVASRTQR
jgi:hypothetical protein